MKKTTATLAQRREQLVALCRTQREELAAQRQLLGQSAASLFSVSSAVDRIGKSPLLLGGVALGFCLVRPRRLFSLLASAAMMWKTWQKIAPVAAIFLNRRQR